MSWVDLEAQNRVEALEARLDAIDEEDAADLAYEPGTPGDWSGPPETVEEALDELAGRDAANLAYDPGTPGDWTGPPETVEEALDELAGRVDPLEALGGGFVDISGSAAAEVGNKITVTLTVTNLAGARVKVELLDSDGPVDASQRALTVTTGTIMISSTLGSDAVLIVDANGSGQIVVDCEDKIGTFAGTLVLVATPIGRPGVVEGVLVAFSD